jgi:hypothetical protein
LTGTVCFPINSAPIVWRHPTAPRQSAASGATLGRTSATRLAVAIGARSLVVAPDDLDDVCWFEASGLRRTVTEIGCRRLYIARFTSRGLRRLPVPVASVCMPAASRSSGRTLGASPRVRS